MTLVGYRKFKGKSKKDGEPYTAYFLYFEYEDKGTEGMVTEDAFLMADMVDETMLGIGAQLEVVYNKRGFATGLREI